MDEDTDLRGATSWQWRRPQTTERLGVGLETYLDGKLSDFRKNAMVVDAWRQVLPSRFYEHCHLSGISRGVLRLEVEPGPYMHELGLLSEELLGHLQRECPRAGLKKIVLRPRRL